MLKILMNLLFLRDFKYWLSCYSEKRILLEKGRAGILFLLAGNTILQCGSHWTQHIYVTQTIKHAIRLNDKMTIQSPHLPWKPAALAGLPCLPDSVSQ